VKDSLGRGGAGKPVQRDNSYDDEKDERGPYLIDLTTSILKKRRKRV